MLADLFKLVKTELEPTSAQLDAIGYEMSDKPLVKACSEDASSDLGITGESLRSSGEAQQLIGRPDENTIIRWAFPVLKVSSRQPVTRLWQIDPLEGVPGYQPDDNTPHGMEKKATPLLSLERLQILLEQHLTLPSDSKQINIRLLVDYVAQWRGVERLPKKVWPLAGEDYSVVFDYIGPLLSDFADLRELFRKLPAHIRPREIWLLDQFGTWSNPRAENSSKSLPPMKTSQLLLVRDSRKTKGELVSELKRCNARYRRVQTLCVTGRTPMYLGLQEPILSNDEAVSRLMQVLYAINRFSRGLLRELRLKIHASTAAELDFWGHDDVRCHNTALFDTGAVVQHRQDHSARLERWIRESNGLAIELIELALASLRPGSDQYYEALLNFPLAAVDQSDKDDASTYFASMAKSIETATEEKNKFELSAILLGVSERLVYPPTEKLQRAIEIAQRYRRRVDVNVSVATGTPQEWMAGEARRAELHLNSDGISMQRHELSKPGSLASFNIKGESIIIESQGHKQWLHYGDAFSAKIFRLHVAKETLKCESVLSRNFHWAESLEQSAKGLTLATSQLLKIHYPSEPTNGPVPQVDSSQAPAWLEQEAVRVDEYGLSATLNIYGTEQIMRWIPPGRFAMGSPEDEEGRLEREVLHDVTLSDGYWLADTPCLQSLWRAVMSDNPSEFVGDSLPVESVSWDRAQQFLDRVNAEYPTLNLSLPTEAQWEYACRAGTQTPYSFGQKIDHDHANYEGKIGNTTEVGRFPRNLWGLYDMHGNVWEWCSDWYGDYSAQHAVNPTGAKEGVLRVLRGGCWANNARVCRSACRDWNEPSARNDGIGFRFAQVDQPKPAKRQPVESGAEAEQARRSRKSRAASDGILDSVKKLFRRDGS